MFKKKETKTSTEKQIKELDAFIASTEPTAEEYNGFIEQKKQLMEILKTEAEAGKAKAEGKSVSKIDVNGIIKIVGTLGLAFVAVVADNAGKQNGKILNNCAWKKFNSNI